jgi:hypothetical protein
MVGFRGNGMNAFYLVAHDRRIHHKKSSRWKLRLHAQACVSSIRIRAVRKRRGTFRHLRKEERCVLVCCNIARSTNFRNITSGEIIMDYRVRPGEVQEDQVTAMLERYSSKWPTSLFMGAAIASIIGSMVLKNQRKHHDALFVGQWVAPFLILGLYNKSVKQHGSDRGGWRRHEPVASDDREESPNAS